LIESAGNRFGALTWDLFSRPHGVRNLGTVAGHPEWLVAGRAELGHFAFDVHVDGAEEVDVLAVRWRDVGRKSIAYHNLPVNEYAKDLASSGLPDPLVTCWTSSLT
jgi:hypothetical protein